MEEQMINNGDAIVNVFGPLFLVAFVLGIVAYILTSIAFTTMARNAGINHAWLAWIPFANLWVFGELVSEKLGGKGGMKFLLATLIYIAASFVPILGTIVGIVYGIFSIFATFWLFDKYSYKASLHTILSIFIPFYYPIVLMVIRNNEAE